MRSAPGHKSYYTQSRPKAVSRWGGSPRHWVPAPTVVGARFIEYNSVLCPGAWPACHAACGWPSAKTQPSRSAGQPAREGRRRASRALHPSRHTLTALVWEKRGGVAGEGLTPLRFVQGEAAPRQRGPCPRKWRNDTAAVGRRPWVQAPPGPPSPPAGRRHGTRQARRKTTAPEKSVHSWATLGPPPLAASTLLLPHSCPTARTARALRPALRNDFSF